MIILCFISDICEIVYSLVNFFGGTAGWTEWADVWIWTCVFVSALMETIGLVFGWTMILLFEEVSKTSINDLFLFLFDEASLASFAGLFLWIGKTKPEMLEIEEDSNAVVLFGEPDEEFPVGKPPSY